MPEAVILIPGIEGKGRAGEREILFAVFKQRNIKGAIPAGWLPYQMGKNLREMASRRCLH